MVGLSYVVSAVNLAALIATHLRSSAQASSRVVQPARQRLCKCHAAMKRWSMRLTRCVYVKFGKVCCAT